MEPTRNCRRLTTAIPDRYREERERVLRILARWEEALRAESLPLSSSSMGTR